MKVSTLEWHTEIFNDTKRARSLCDSRATCTCCYQISGWTVISYYQMYPYWIVITSVLNNCYRAVSLRQPSYLYLLLSHIRLHCYQLLPDVSVLNCHYISFEQLRDTIIPAQNDVGCCLQCWIMSWADANHFLTVTNVIGSQVFKNVLNIRSCADCNSWICLVVSIGEGATPKGISLSTVICT